MGLPLRITFKDNDYVYQIIDSKLIDHNTTEVELVLNGERIEIIRDIKLVWKQKQSDITIDSELVQALGRSISLRLRM
jgi:sporulation protein YlmC with PRC-barrel domain